MQHPNFTILGDFNFYLDDLTNKETEQLIDNLRCFELKNLVYHASHTAGHTLDGIFSLITC